ncbi:MAG: hypothetical protein JJW03_05395 [Desulfosarcina sp.]|nr:hypothetical protein [Desulfobacterales bacterium]
MILNNFIVTYLVCAAMSLFTGIIASVNGLYIWKRWNPDNQAEDQYVLEKRVYLVITVCSLGFILRLLMFPLWFRTLHSMIISIPGAMCLVGVHNINPPLAYAASGFKLVMPALYGYWLILNFMDRKIPEQPFMKHKLLLLTFLGCLATVETILDISFFFSAPPRQVSCCTSLFDVPRDDILQVVTESSMVWVFLFFALSVFIIGEMVFFLIAQRKSLRSKPGKWLPGKWFGNKRLNSKPAMVFQTLIIISLFGIFILSLQTTISPLFLGLPFHHCIFCLCQEVWDATLSLFMIFTGLSLFLIYFWITSSANYREVNQILNASMQKLLKWSLVMFAGGLIILAVHLTAV